MWIIEKFHEGGLPFMLFLFLLNIGIIMMIIKTILDRNAVEKAKRDLKIMIELGLFALFSGIFIQLIGLYQVLAVLEEVGDISPALLMGGLKVSMYTTLYGGYIFAFTGMVWFVLKYFVVQQAHLHK
jgi:hypothetical protein